jgi:competence protein ComEC
MKRPLIPVALLFVLGILLAFLPVPLIVLFGVSFALALLFLVLPRARPLLLGALVVMTGWVNHACRTAVLSPVDLRVIFGNRGAAVTVRGRLVATPSHRFHHNLKKQEDYWTATAEIAISQVHEDGHDWQPAFGRIEAVTREDEPDDFFAGQTVEIANALRPPPGPLAEGLFDYREYLTDQGIYYEMNIPSTNRWKVIASPRSPPLSDCFSAWARESLARGLPVRDQYLRLEWALTLGWKAALTDQVVEPFIQAGTYHIFAVDGLRIAIIAGILTGLFRAAGIPRAYGGLLAAPLIVFYTAMTGWPASAVRAMVMILVIFGGWALKRPSDLINSLFAAAVIILLWEPRQLFQAGFQLSFFVVLCIILILPFFNRVGEWALRPDPLLPESLRPWWQRWLHPPARWLIDLFMSSTAAWLGAIPLVALYFHLFTPLSSFTNVVAVPLCSLVLVCNLSCLLLVSWLPGIAVLFNHAGWFLMKCIQTTTNFSSTCPGCYYYLPMPSLFTIGVYYFLLLGALTGWLFQGRRRRWKIGGAAALCAVWCAIQLWERPASHLTVLPLEQGHAVYASGPGWHNDWLVDCGDVNLADSVTKPFLRAQGVNRLSHFVVSHAEDESMGGAPLICREFRPRNIYVSPLHFESDSYGPFIESFKTNHLHPQMLQSGGELGPFVAVVPPVEGQRAKADDAPVVLRAEIERVRVLFVPNLSHAGQNALLNSDTNFVRADIVVAGMPSKSEPLSDAFLDFVRPRVIVIANSGASADSPASRALKARLAERNLPVFYTGETRAVTITIRPGRWEVRAMDGSVVSVRND